MIATTITIAKTSKTNIGKALRKTFNVSNNFLSGKSKLTIEVPIVALENIKLPDMKEICAMKALISLICT
ncbi:hypothetical protein C2S07_01715 [Helicobacter pylori]|nr:hypothetical protein C2S07_01715 [Helicobacter pylori]